MIGLPDERFGEVICAVIEVEDPSAPPEESEIVEHVRSRLARYKAPRKVVVVGSIGRSPAGKVDYKGVKDVALQRLR